MRIAQKPKRSKRDFEIRKLKRKVAELEKLVFASYMLAGEIGAPLRWLDALSNLRYTEDLLPISAQECSEFQKLSPLATTPYVVLPPAP